MGNQKIIKIIISWILILGWIVLVVFFAMDSEVGPKVNPKLYSWTTSKEVTDCGLKTKGWSVYREKQWTGTIGGVYREPEYIKIEGLSASNFKCINGYYGKSDDTIYYTWFDISADYETFKTLDGFYAQDKDSVFFKWNTINADSKTFSVFRENVVYARDKDSVFCKWEKIEWADAQTFVIDKNAWMMATFDWKAHDKNKEYRCAMIKT